MTRVFKPEWRKRIGARCAGCGCEFMAVESEVRRGKGRTCSLSCAASLAADYRPSQAGSRNPNWKGGVPREAKYREAKRTYRLRHPERAQAHMQVRDAVRDGLLKPLACEVCGALAAEAHHDDYDRPLDVRWLCKPHHMQHHKAARRAVAA